MQSTDQESETICHLTRKGPLLGKNKQTSVRSHRDGTVPAKTMSSHKKGTAPNRTDCCVISQERDRSLKNKLLCHLTRKGLLLKQIKTPTKLSQQITKKRVDLWNLVTTCGMALRLEILIAGGSVYPQGVVKQCFKRIFKHFLIALETRPHSVQWVIIQDKPGRVLRSFVLDHSLAVQPKTV